MEAARIVILGAGNVASQLAPAIVAAGHAVVQIYSPTESHARELAKTIDCGWCTSVRDVVPDADLYIICVRDSAVADTAMDMPRVSGVVVHTSGTITMEELLPASDRVGVLYPLQTFSKGRNLDISEVPFFTEANSTATLEFIDSFASDLSRSVHHADSSTRPFLHVAGVLGCNFPNYMLSCAQEMLERGGLSLNVLRPLLQETIEKAFLIGPKAAQTGPARRGDSSTILRHAAMLPTEQAALYLLISEAIQKRYRHEN